MSVIANNMEIDMGIPFTIRLKAHYRFSREVLSRDEQVCRSCGSSTGIRAYRIVPREDVYGYVISNGISLCEICRDKARSESKGFSREELLGIINKKEIPKPGIMTSIQKIFSNTCKKVKKLL